MIPVTCDFTASWWTDCMANGTAPSERMDGVNGNECRPAGRQADRHWYQHVTQTDTHTQQRRRSLVDQKKGRMSLTHTHTHKRHHTHAERERERPTTTTASSQHDDHMRVRTLTHSQYDNAMRAERAKEEDDEKGKEAGVGGGERLTD